MLAFFNSLYAFAIVPDADEDVVPILTIGWRQGGAETASHLLNVGGTEFILLPKLRAAPFRLSSSGVKTAKLSLAASLRARLRAGWIKKKNVLGYPDFTIQIGGAKRFRRVLISATKYLQKLGTPLNGATIRQRPELLLGWGPGAVPLPPFRGEPRRTEAKVAVVLHLYYADLWPEISTVLQSLPLAFDLIVTTVPGREALIDAVRADFPSAAIRVVENRGRDVRPFLLLLEEGALDAYDCVCKIHGKKSLHGLKRNPYGEIWRRRLLFDLLCAEGAMAAAVERFEREPRLGLLGPEAFRVAGAEIADFYWRKNRERLAWLLERLGIDAARIEPDFFAGTMFWVRPKALGPLRKLVLSRDFEPDQGRTDGALEHAVERVLAIAVKTADYGIQEINGLRI
ncbi:MAG TPA: rhamnan synthesis F family protein [Roseiarcus sp.]